MAKSTVSLVVPVAGADMVSELPETAETVAPVAMSFPKMPKGGVAVTLGKPPEVTVSWVEPLVTETFATASCRPPVPAPPPLQGA